MGKKPVVVNEQPPKKKRSCCCTCMLTVFIVALVLIVGGTAVGCIFLDKYTKKNFDMGLGECLGVLNGLYWASDKNMVDYGYTEADAAAFDTEIKHQLFLKEDADLDLTAAVKLFMESADAGNTATDAVQAKLMRALAADGATGAEGGTTETGTDKLLNFIVGLFSRDSMDYGRLSAYDKANHSDYNFRLNDKQLAAFVNEVFTAVEGDIPALEPLKQMGVEKLSDALALRQIKFVKENRAVYADGTWSDETRDVTMAKVTLQIKVSEILKSASKEYIPNGFAAGLASWALKTVLPNNLYVTAGIGLTDNVGVDLAVNRINTPEKTESTYKLIRGITRLTGSELDVPQKMTELVSKSVEPTLKSIDDVADFSKVENGTLAFDTYGALANMAVAGNAEAENKLTGEDILYTFSRLVTSDPKIVAPEHDYKNWYLYTGGSETGKKVYAVDPAVLTDPHKKVDYQQEFMNELKNKYMLKTTKPDGSEYTFSEIIAAFGMGGEASGDILDLIDMSRFGEATAGKTEEDLRIALNDKMLGAIVEENLESLGADALGLAGLKLEVEQTALLSRERDAVRHDFIDISVSLDLSDLFESMGGIGKFVYAFLPEKVVVSIQVDITVGLPDGVSRTAPAISYNSMSPEETAEMLSVLDKFGVEGFNTADISGMIAKPVNQIIDTMSEHLVISVVPSRLAESDAPGTEDVADDAHDLELPSIYGLLEKNVFTKEGETVAAADIKAVFDELYAYDASNADAADKVDALKSGLSRAAENYNALIDSLERDYYLKTEHAENITTFDALFHEISSLGSEFDASKFDVEALKHDSRAASALRPYMTDGELARLFIEKMAGAVGENANAEFTVEGVKIAAGTDGYDAVLQVLVKFDISKLMGDKASIMPVSRMFATLKVYVTDDTSKLVVVDDSDPANIRYAYKTEFEINDMIKGADASVQDNLMKMIGMFGGEGLVNPQSIAADMGAMLYEQIKLMNDKLGGGISFADGKVEFAGFYEFLATATGLNPEGGYGANRAEIADNLKAAVQGMYSKTPSDATSSENNYVIEDGADAGLLFNRIGADAPVGSLTYDDKQLGYFLSQAIGLSGASAQLGTLEQTVISAAGDRSVGKGKEAYDWIGGFKDLSAQNGDLVALTFKMSINDFTQTASSGLASALLPQDVYATMVFAYGATAAYTSVYFRINELTETEQNILLKIANLDTFDTNSILKSDACTQLLRKFRGASYQASAGAGIGQITFAGYDL